MPCYVIRVIARGHVDGRHDLNPVIRNEQKTSFIRDFRSFNSSRIFFNPLPNVYIYIYFSIFCFELIFIILFSFIKILLKRFVWDCLQWSMIENKRMRRLVLSEHFSDGIRYFPLSFRFIGIRDTHERNVNPAISRVYHPRGNLQPKLLPRTMHRPSAEFFHPFIYTRSSYYTRPRSRNIVQIVLLSATLRPPHATIKVPMIYSTVQVRFNDSSTLGSKYIRWTVQRNKNDLNDSSNKF